MSFALLTCTPPNFGPPITGDPLTLFPLQPEITAGMSFTFAVAGGTPSYIFHAEEGTITSTGKYTAPPYPPADNTDTVWVTDQEDNTAETIVVVKPKPLLLTPGSASIFLNDVITIVATGGKPPYTLSEPGAGVLTQMTSNTWSFASASAYDATITLTDNSIPAIPPAYSWITILPTPTELSISPDSISLRVGDVFTFTAAGGTSPYIFAKVSGVNNITGGGVYTASQVTPVTPVTPDVIRVTDSAATPATDTAEVTVTYHPLQISPTAINLPFNAGQDFNATGGNSDYRFTIVSGNGDINLSTGIFTAPASVGQTVVQVSDTASSTPCEATVNVYEPLVISPKLPTVDAGDTLPFTATGGIKGPGYTYSKVSGIGDIDPSTGVYSAPGTSGTAIIRVTDSIGTIDWTTVTVVDPATWGTRSTADSNKAGFNASLALDSTDNPFIAYYETVGKDLKLARRDGSLWNRETIYTGANNSKYPSLAMDGSNHPRVAWNEADDHSLRYAEKPMFTWDTRTVVNSHVGQYVSLALDVSDNPRIAYYDDSSRDLKYVIRSGPNWDTPVTVDSADDVGKFASLALDGSGNPRIAYYDATNKNLEYAKWNGSWTTETVDSSGDVGQYASLALDSAENPHIAYYDATNKDLKYAAWNGTSWDIETLDDSSNDVGKYASLALDSSGKARIAYYDATGGNLKYAGLNVSIWLIGTVDTGPNGGTNNVGQYTSLAITSADLMKIAYHDVTGVDLFLISEQP